MAEGSSRGEYVLLALGFSAFVLSAWVYAYVSYFHDGSAGLPVTSETVPDPFEGLYETASTSLPSFLRVTHIADDVYRLMGESFTKDAKGGISISTIRGVIELDRSALPYSFAQYSSEITENGKGKYGGCAIDLAFREVTPPPPAHIDPLTAYSFSPQIQRTVTANQVLTGYCDGFSGDYDSHDSASTTASVNVLDLVPRGFLVLGAAEGDLNGDGRNDVALALADEREYDPQDFDSSEYDNWNLPRSLLILVQAPDGSYHVAARNDSIILSKGMGGAFGDPFAGVTIDKGMLSIDDYGGSADRWYDSYEFSYEKAKNDWFLIKQTRGGYNVFDPDATTSETVTTARDFGLVRFADAPLLQ